jgi:hypothetical protein
MRWCRDSKWKSCTTPMIVPIGRTVCETLTDGMCADHRIPQRRVTAASLITEAKRESAAPRLLSKKRPAAVRNAVGFEEKARSSPVRT